MIVVLMGVTGAGKSTVGRLLAEDLGWEFMDGDEFHSAANLEKMGAGIALDDEDRRPWLQNLRAQILRREAEHKNLVLACSALKKDYRAILAVSPAVRFVYLKGDAQLIAQRLGRRRGHFADQKILAAQFADLEEPESGGAVQIAATPQQIVKAIRKKLRV